LAKKKYKVALVPGNNVKVYSHDCFNGPIWHCAAISIATISIAPISIAAISIDAISIVVISTDAISIGAISMEQHA
jgi:hypothetical protein